MNKKLFSGMALTMATAAAFWACGEGNINNKDFNDDIMAASNDQDLQDLKNQAKEECKITPDCYAKYQGYLEGIEDLPESSDDSNPGLASSSSVGGGTFNLGSSSSIVIIRSSSSITVIDDTGASSSSGAAAISDDTFGTCAAAKNPVNKGDAVQWKFTGNKNYPGYDYMKIAQADYAWSFAAGATVDDASKKTPTVSYPNSGATTASVVVTYDGSPIKVDCEPLQVNGDPITCTCAASGGDVTKDNGVATWTATCTSPSAITSYNWDGTDAGATGSTFTHLFAAKGDTHTPVLKVGNADNTVVTVTCPEVVATDASIPDYILDATTKSVTVPAGTAIVTASYAKTDIQWNGEIAGMQCNFYCQTTSNDPMDITVDGVSMDGKNYITAQIPCESLVDGYQLKIVSNMEVTCGKQ